MNNNYIEYESIGDRNKNLSISEYLDEINIYLKFIIIILQKSSTWKIQLTVATKVISYTDTDEDHIMHSNSDNIEVMTYHNAKDSDEDPSELFLLRYQIGLEIIMTGIDFTFLSLILLIWYITNAIN